MPGLSRTTSIAIFAESLADASRPRARPDDGECARAGGVVAAGAGDERRKRRAVTVFKVA